jgi:hypothetical protein
MMTTFYFHAPVDDPQLLADALARVTGIADIRLFEPGAVPDAMPAGTLNVEWIRRRGQFALDVRVYAKDFATRETEARFCRAVAKALGKPVLFSDCSAFPYSYFAAEPDGSIWAQLLANDDDDDEQMDVAVVDHIDPHHAYPRQTFAADEALPARDAGAPTSWTQGDTRCEIAGNSPCRTFAMPCPKFRLAHGR